MENSRNMKKILFALLLLCTSCTSNEELAHFEYTHDEYCVMFAFMEELHESGLFDIAEPEKPSFDEMMMVAGPIIMSDTFGDTLAEGDCLDVYLLMYRYFSELYPEASVTKYLNYILTNEMY